MRKDLQQIVRVGNKAAKDMAKVTNKANMLKKLVKTAERLHPMGTPVHKIQGPSKRAENEHIECGCELCKTWPSELKTIDVSAMTVASAHNELLRFLKRKLG